MMTFVPNGINQGALVLPAKHESCWQIEFGAPVLGLLTCGARSWRGTAVPWLQAQEMPIASAVPCIEHSNYDPEGRSQTLDGFL